MAEFLIGSGRRAGFARNSFSPRLRIVTVSPLTGYPDAMNARSRFTRAAPILLAACCVILAACAPPIVDSAGPTPTGEGIFLHGCPVEGEAFARTLVDVAERPWGEEGLAGPGDVVLANTKAAFVIQGIDDPDTYYHYGGAPIDAVAVQDCEQAGPERFEEMGFLVGQLDLLDFNASSLHQVRGTAIDVVNDGSDGKAAVVEVTATDDRFWLVELTLIRNTYEDGGRKTLDELYGLDITLRYTLDPDASALQMEVLLGGEPITDGFLVGALVFPSDLNDVHAFADGELSVGGFHLDLEVPWLSIAGDQGSFAVALPDANLGYTSVAGVRALVNVDQALAPIMVGEAAEPVGTTFLLAAGATDGSSATAGLEAYVAEPLSGAEWSEISGSVEDSSGPVAGADVWVYANDESGASRLLDRLVSGTDGRFAGRTVAPASGWSVYASGSGRDDGEQVRVNAGESALLSIGEAGQVAVHVVDENNVAIPARIEVERSDGVVSVQYAMPNDTLALAPGEYRAWVSRGYEYQVIETTLSVPTGGSATLKATLEHALDTTGWASVDTHVHAEASADSDTLADDRMKTAAAAGLDVVVSTDHEAIISMQGVLDEIGLSEWLAYGLGSEVTATVPEHVNAWPFPVQGGDRGDPVRWYQLGFPELYAAIRERGARVVQLNHSRVNGECGILCVLDWDRQASTLVMDDPEALGFPAGTEIWSWDFDTFELINGLRSPLLSVSDPRHTGALHDWLAFHNLGHRVTAVGVTDVHGLDIPGSPRTYVRVGDDAAGVVSADDVADGELAGAAVVSAGAFARVEIDGAGPGDDVSVVGDVVLSIEVSALPEIDVDRIVVLANCDLVAEFSADSPDELLKFEGGLVFSLAQDAHVVVLGFGSQSMPRGLENYDASTVPRFVSNPIFVDADGDGVWTAPGAKSCATGIDLP